MPELRRRKQGAKDGDSKPAFSNLAADDAALSADDETLPDRRGLSNFGKLLLFIAFPFFIGTCALYTGYLRQYKYPEKELNFDNDFVFPFLLALTMVLVVGFQTSGFANTNPKPLVSWPKVRRRKKVIRKTVIVDDDEVDPRKEA